MIKTYSAYVEDAFKSIDAWLERARWKFRGVYMVYAAESISRVDLEMVVHLPREVKLNTLYVRILAVLDSKHVITMKPLHWNISTPPESTQKYLDTPCLIVYRRLTIKHGGPVLPQPVRKRCPTPYRKHIPLDADRLAAICKALSHKARVQILAHLKSIDRCVCGQLVEVLPLAQSTVSQHLKILKTAGLINGEVEGPRTCYCINHDAMDELKALVESL